MDKEKRKPTRLQNFDYSSNGYYFITICTKDMECILSTIENVGDGVLDVPRINLSECGIIVKNRIIEINKVYSNVTAEHYVIMPNHLHILLFVDNGTSRTPSPTNSLVSSYVSTLKRMTNKEIGSTIWQRSFYDHIIRYEEDYLNHIQYINENPRKWLIGKDEYYI